MSRSRRCRPRRWLSGEAQAGGDRREWLGATGKERCEPPDAQRDDEHGAHEDDLAYESQQLSSHWRPTISDSRRRLHDSVPNSRLGRACYVASTSYPHTDVDFIAYADDYVAHGEILLKHERLADQLVASEELRAEGLTVRALDDGRQHLLPFAEIGRDELCAVVGSGPRGNPTRRFRTRAYPMRASAGPYVVVGYLHAVPTADPRVVAMRRQIIVLSPARISFIMAGTPVDETHDALLIVRTKVTALESASDEDMGLSKALEASANVDPRAKDLTGEVQGRDRDAK